MATNPNRTLVKLGKQEVSLRYDMAAILILDERGINIYNPATYATFSPTKLRDLVWAGQLHTKEPKTLAELTKFLPTKADDYGEIATAIAAAIREAISPPKE